MGNFQGVKERALELVPELGHSFEEVKEDKAQIDEMKEEEKEDKGKQQILMEYAKEPSTWLEGESRIVVGAYWVLHFLDKESRKFWLSTSFTSSRRS